MLLKNTRIVKRNQLVFFVAVVLLFLLSRASSFGAVKLIPLLSFDGTNGTHPRFDLVQGKNGNFFGTALGGSVDDAGTVFSIVPDGQPVFVASMAITNGRTPSGLILGSDGNFYCAAESGGPYERGTIFRMTSQGNLRVMAVFDGTNGVSPSDLLQGADGNFYGTTQYLMNPTYAGSGSVFRMSPNGDITNLFVFSGTNGMTPSSLVQGRDGNLYGTTAYGGPAFVPDQSDGNGTVFQITTNGVLTTLWYFSGGDGTYPESVIQATDGNLYGAAYYGCSNNLGSLFRLTTNGVFSILHYFSPFGTLGNNSDGGYPTAQLMQSKDGSIYGGTEAGGSSLTDYGGIGTLFKITTNGDFTTLCSFGSYTNFYSEGSIPSGLVQDKKGNFFGATYYGGPYGGAGNLGGIFKLVTVRPIIAITEPRQDGPFTNAAVTVSGKAKAEVQTAITNVLYQLNGGDWTAVATTNNWTNWTANITLAEGENRFCAYALDANGDASRTNVLRLRFRP